MKNIFIVTDGRLPVPAVRGGAVETLINHILKQNEKRKQYHFVVAGMYDVEAQKEAKNYLYSDFIFIRKSYCMSELLLFVSKVIYKIKRYSPKLDEKFYAWRVKRLIKKSKIALDYIVVENNVNLIFALAKENIPLILHLHNDYLNENIVNAGRIADKCKEIWVISDFLKQRVSSLPGAAEKVRVFQNCIEIEDFRREKYTAFREEFRSKHQLSEEDMVLIYSGRIHPTKGVKELVSALQRIDNPHVHALLVGGTWYSSSATTDYMRQVQEIASLIKDRIYMTGYVSYSDIAKYYSAADVAVVPSIWEEPSGLVVLEAQAMGLPVIATASGGIPEISNSESALYVSKDNTEKMIGELIEKINFLYDNRHMCYEMGQVGIKIAEHYNTYVYYENFCELIERV